MRLSDVAIGEVLSRRGTSQVAQMFAKGAKRGTIQGFFASVVLFIPDAALHEHHTVRMCGEPLARWILLSNCGGCLGTCDVDDGDVCRPNYTCSHHSFS